VGAVVGATMMWSGHDDRPLPRAPASIEPARMAVPPLPLPPIAPTAVLSPPLDVTAAGSPALATAPGPAPSSQSSPPAPAQATQGTGVAGAAGGHKPPLAHAKDQVGAAGISSQF
jgi:hypothetical protein